MIATGWMNTIFSSHCILSMTFTWLSLFYERGGHDPKKLGKLFKVPQAAEAGLGWSFWLVSPCASLITLPCLSNKIKALGRWLGTAFWKVMVSVFIPLLLSRQYAWLHNLTSDYWEVDGYLPRWSPGRKWVFQRTK